MRITCGNNKQMQFANFMNSSFYSFINRIALASLLSA